MSGSDPDPPPTSTPPAEAVVVRCPRCGGVATARPHRPNARNPFLAKKKPDQVTCEDCGLDFERPSDGVRDSGRDSGRSPWSRP